MEFVFLFLINALNMMPMEPVLLASVDMTSSMEFVNSQLSIMPSLLIQDVLNGTGTTKFVYNAQKTGFSMLMEFVSLFQTNVPPTMPMELVFHATRATI